MQRRHQDVSSYRSKRNRFLIAETQMGIVLHRNTLVVVIPISDSFAGQVWTIWSHKYPELTTCNPTWVHLREERYVFSVLVCDAEPLKYLSFSESNTFLSLFESYVNVMHDMISTRDGATQDGVRNIVPLCLASFRRLLKASLHVAEQRYEKYSYRSVCLTCAWLALSFYSGRSRSVQDAAIANKCAGLLEKLFQLVADGYKTQFLKVCWGHFDIQCGNLSIWFFL